MNDAELKQIEELLDAKLAVMLPKKQVISEPLMQRIQDAITDSLRGVEQRLFDSLAMRLADRGKTIEFEPKPEHTDGSNASLAQKVSILWANATERTTEVAAKTKNWIVRLWQWAKDKAVAFKNWCDRIFDKHPTSVYLGGCIAFAAAAVAIPSLIVSLLSSTGITLLSIRYLVHAEELDDKRVAIRKSVGAAGNEDEMPSRVEILVKRIVAMIGLSLSLGSVLSAGIQLAFRAVDWFNGQWVAAEEVGSTLADASLVPVVA